MSNRVPVSEGAQRILTVAAGLFAKEGYAAVSVNDIAAAAGGSKANVFHHFPTKDALYLAVIRSACEGFADELDAMAENHDDDGNRLRSIAISHMHHLMSNPDSTRLILREVFAEDSGINRALIASILHQNFELIVRRVKQGQENGRFRKDVDSAMVAVVLLALNIFYFQTNTIFEQFDGLKDIDSPQRFAEVAFDTLSKGLLSS